MSKYPPAANSDHQGALAENNDTFFGHPRGLSTLFFTEMWERFSYYGMRALLILFMTAPLTAGGLEFDIVTAGAVYGLYTSMVYMFTLPGGWIADRLIGQQRAVFYGGILIACGHFSMAVPSVATFYLGLFLIVVGTGLLKGNISVLVGQLYMPGDKRRDAGFSIYYMGINLGAFFSPLVCGFLGQRIDWHLGFAAAGVGMVLGLIQYTFGTKYLGTAGLYPTIKTSPETTAQLKFKTLLVSGIAIVFLIILSIGIYTGTFPITPTQVANWAGYALLIICVGFFGWLFLRKDWTPKERKQLYAIGVFFLAAALFWSMFDQAGSTMNLFADRNTHNSILGFEFPSSWFQSINPLFVWMFAPIFAWLWLKLGRYEPSTPVKFACGQILVGAGFAVLVVAAVLSGAGNQVSPTWLIVTYLLHTFGELCLSPVGLSAMTKLAPARIAGLMMGVWFLAASVGSFIAGRLAGFYESMPLPTLFTAVSIFGILSGLLLLPFVKPIKKLMGEVS